MKAIEEYIKRTTPPPTLPELVDPGSEAPPVVVSRPTRPETVQEAMENADIIAKMPIGERDSLDDNLVDLAAYVRELEAWADDRDKCSDRAAILGHGEGKP